MEIDSILENGNVQSEEDVQQQARELEIPYVDLRAEEISEKILKEISLQIVKTHMLVPFKKEGDVLSVGMIDVKDTRALEALRFVALWHKYKIKTYLISRESFDTVMKKYDTLSIETGRALEKLEKELKGGAEEKELEDLFADGKKGKKEVIEEEAPISRIVAVVLKHAIEGRASDIHIEPTEGDLKVRFRVDGLLHSSIILPKTIAGAVVSRIKILSNLKIDETRKPQDGRFRINISGKKIDLRVSTFPTANGEKVAMRILESSSGIKTLDDLGINKTYQKIFNKEIEKPFGMILVCGPTGSGKSTTLYVLLQFLNQEGVNIITLEDPIEYYVNGINQSQIRPEIGYSFATGLRHILRQDPDVIMVGEIRDNETAGLGVHAALTGHLLLSTIHTNNAIGAIPRLIDMGIEPFLIPASLNVVVSQRLVKKICVKCKEEVEVTDEVAEKIIRELLPVPAEALAQEGIYLKKESFKLFSGRGCKVCAEKGTKGRIGIYELLQMTPELEKIVIKDHSAVDVVEESKRQNMITMKQDGIIKALKGIVTLEEVYRVVEE